MVEVQRDRKQTRARRVRKILEALSRGTVIVEGVHDVKALCALGVDAIPYSKLLSGALPSAGSTVFVIADRDRGGEEKKGKIVSALMEANGAYTINETLGRMLLSMLNATSVEQVCGPVFEALEEGEVKGEKNGKNILRYSKVHGAG